MLLVDLGAAAEGPVETEGQVAADAEVFAGLEFALLVPVQVSGRLMASGPGCYFWHARVRTHMGLACRRCLKELDLAVDQELELLFSEDETADDPSVYPLEPKAVRLDLTDAVREELILAAPAYPLCREDCLGLCPQCGKDLNAGACTCRPAPDPRWGALESLRTADDATPDS